ncbi:hypothetical protein [Chitinophaga sp. MD30]|uniref:hypothetical protein n=1 Tax=Chitinophaga sp. MD30 TaxID=2033437 RepID=UPI000BB0981F|nr:hypothetical protein [Chitinophaga sp. MD30]ASZ13059.1 hypothetical protein CK934_19890 [Chitinophaga sp. MD30]
MICLAVTAKILVTGLATDNHSPVPNPGIQPAIASGELQSTDAIPAQPVITGTDNCTTGTITATQKQKVRYHPACSYLLPCMDTEDACNNAATYAQLIHVQDTTRPTFSVSIPKDTTLNCDKVPAPTITGRDNCNGNQIITATMVETRRNLSATCASNYELTRVWTLTDPW